MTNLPDDLIDPSEGRLIRRVHAWSDPAVVPIDPVAVAAVAARTRTRRGVTGGSSRFGWLGWLIVGAALTGVVIGGAMGIGAFKGPLSSVGPSAEPTPLTAEAGCLANELSGRIVSWDGAAGSRIAAVELTSSAAGDCVLPVDPRLRLVDANGAVLIANPLERWRLSTRQQPTIAAGGTIHTLVAVGNYCGPTPAEPVSIVISASFGLFTDEIVFAPVSGGLSGVPPCNGNAGPTDGISMQDWEPGPATP